MTGMLVPMCKQKKKGGGGERERKQKDLASSDSDLMKRLTKDIGQVPRMCLDKVLTEGLLRV